MSVDIESGVFVSYILYLIVKTVMIAIYGETLLLFARVILGIFPVAEDSLLAQAVLVMTEPAVLPFRVLLERNENIRDFPVDLSLFVCMIAFSILPALLPVVTL